MKYKVGDIVNIKSAKELCEKGLLDKDEAEGCSDFYGTSGKISSIRDGFVRVDLSDKKYVAICEDKFDSFVCSDNYEDNIKNIFLCISEAVKKNNCGISVDMKDGKIIIVPLNNEEEEDLPIDTPVMVKCGMWNLGYYAGNNKVFVIGKSNECENQTACGFEIIIPFDRFNPNDIEESLKYNIVK